MLLAIYGDVHLTKKMGNLQSYWDESAIKVFENLYAEFCANNIESAICLGDFFDAPRLEAKSVGLVTKILSIINESPFPTYLLLGNHEIFDDESNILDFLSEYDNIIPVTELQEYEGKLFIPYNVDIKDIPPEMMTGKYVFTHHDIYGSELANGKVKASFGVNPEVFSTAKKVFNGHVHLCSEFSNIINVGSLLKSQHGELRLFEYPHIYYLDTNKDTMYSSLIKEDFIAYLTITSSSIEEVLKSYSNSVKFVIKIDYEDDSEIEGFHRIQESDSRILKLSLRKVISESLDTPTEYIKSNLDIKEIITKYIQSDMTVTDSDKERLINIGLDLLEV